MQKLYVVRGSNNCRKVEAVVGNLGLEVETVALDFASGGLKTPEYLALNPNGKVPTLVDGDYTLWESNAIMQYLADGAPDNTLYPRDGRTRIEIHRWQFWETAHYNRWLGTLAFEIMLKPMFNLGQPDEAHIAEARGFFDKFAPVLDARLSQGPFLVGANPTLADFSVGSFAAFVGGMGLNLNDYPHLRDWYARLDSVPGWAATAPRMAA
ncbi:MAG: glutathione S-transferase family protein [Hyphomicrobiales bacterium]|nr:glutathione S-transferase family protein [Hyphomicrobiales bacterium]MCP5374245.1 glutathione S-transferase family protein [Hyphomicrobiales bacterium]